METAVVGPDTSSTTMRWIILDKQTNRWIGNRLVSGVVVVVIIEDNLVKVGV